jgi:hypothetical protein
MTILQMQTLQTARPNPLLESLKYGAVTFIGIVGVLGMVLSYAPDDVISALYYAGLACAVVAGFGKWISSRTQT